MSYTLPVDSVQILSTKGPTGERVGSGRARPAQCYPGSSTNWLRPERPTDGTAEQVRFNTLLNRSPRNSECLRTLYFLHMWNPQIPTGHTSASVRHPFLSFLTSHSTMFYYALALEYTENSCFLNSCDCDSFLMCTAGCLVLEAAPGPLSTGAPELRCRGSAAPQTVGLGAPPGSDQSLLPRKPGSQPLNHQGSPWWDLPIWLLAKSWGHVFKMLLVPRTYFFSTHLYL